MRLSQNPPTLLSLLFTVLSHASTAKATPALDLTFGFLQERQNGNCGADNQYTCLAGQACTTTNNIASCVPAVAGGYATYTTTFTETNLVLRTSTYTSAWQAPATTAAWVNPIIPAQASCLPQPAQYSCGAICCAANQRCLQWGSCTEVGVQNAPSTLWTYTNQPAPTVDPGVLPFRPTSGGASTLTSFRSATTTMPFLAPATASGSTLPITAQSSGGGLSAGAIAGIVIAVIAGIIILLLICFCCILKGALSTILGIFGLGKKKRRTTERTETVEHYSRHGSAAAGSRRDTHTNWFGRPTKVSEKRKEKKSGGFGGLGAVGAGLAGLALVLGLKRSHDKKKTSSRPAHSDISSSYYTDSYTGTSASSASSRTRDSRHHSRR